MATDQVRDRISELLTAPLLAAGLDLEAVDLTPAGKRRVLRVAVDKDGGVTLDDVADATKEVSRILDASDVMGQQPYTLEVSSPGVDRPLSHPRHWRRNTGRLVTLTIEGESLTGRVITCDDVGATVQVEGEQRQVTFDEVQKARVQVELNRPADHRDAEHAEAREG